MFPPACFSHNVIGSPFLQVSFTVANDVSLFDPKGCCTDGTYLYVCDYYNFRIVKKTIPGLITVAQIGYTGTGNDNFNHPVCIATDGTYLYITEDTNNRIQKRLCSDLSYVAKIGSTGSGNDQFNSPAGIATDGTHVYICDTGNYRVQKRLCSDLSYVAQIGSQGTGDDQFDQPFGIMYYADNVYISDSKANAFRIHKRLAADLSFVAAYCTYGTGNGQAYKSYGFCTDGTYLYLADYSLKNLKKMQLSDFTGISHYGNTGVGDGDFNFPHGICIQGENLYIVDMTGRRVKIHAVSNFAYVGQSGGVGNGINFDPIIKYDAVAYTGTWLLDDGTSFPVASDTEISWRAKSGYEIFPVGTHTAVFSGVPVGEIKIVDNNHYTGTDPWPITQVTPVMNLGSFALVWFDGTTYHAYYGYDAYSKIGHATSSDGITFTEDTVNNPVLVVGPGGTYDQTLVAVANVWVEGATWYMLYRGNGLNTCLATSSDGLDWTKYVSNPVILNQADPAGIMKVGSTYWLYANTTGGNRKIDVYTSSDLHTWTKQTPSPLFAGMRYCSCPFKYNSKYYLLVSKNNNMNQGGVIELFEDSTPAFLTARLLGVVISHPLTASVDTPTLVTDTIYRDSFPGGFICYFSMAYGVNTYPLFRTFNADAATAIALAQNPLQNGVLV